MRQDSWEFTMYDNADDNAHMKLQKVRYEKKVKGYHLITHKFLEKKKCFKNLNIIFIIHKK